LPKQDLIEGATQDCMHLTLGLRLVLQEWMND